MSISGLINNTVMLYRQICYIFNRYYANVVLGNNLEFFELTDSTNKYKYFYHNHNLGYHCLRYTERIIELSLANEWLEKCPDSWEIGAVTPYYWPKRVKWIVDPTDKHPQVSHRISMFDLDFTGKDVLMISTLEHIGSCEYGIDEEFNSIQAFLKISNEARNYLITFPIGWNALLDEFVLSGKSDSYCKVRYLVRNKYELWNSTTRDFARMPYGKKKHWANSVVILEKGDIL
jgi:hypothetical protein